MSFIAVLNTDSGSFEIQEEQIYPIQIPSAGNWTFKAQANDVLLSVSNQESGANSMSFGNKFTISIDAPQTLYVKYSSPLQGLKTANILYNNYIAQGGGGSGGGGGGASSGQAPILVENGVIKLLVTDEFLVNEANQLALALNNNEVIKQIISQLNSLKGSLEYIGQIQSSNQQVAETPNLLTEFVKTQQSREPQAGDLITTNDTPPYAWIYASNKGAGGEITSYEWKPMGTTGLSVASNTTLGIVKGAASGAGKVSVGADGTMTVNDVLLLTSTQGQTINSNLTLPSQYGLTLGTSATLQGQASGLQLNSSNFTVNGILRYLYTNRPTVSQDNEIPSWKQVKDTIASRANALILGAETPTTNNVPQGKLALYIQPQS